MITIKTTQKKYKVNLDQLKKDAREILGLLNYHEFELNIVLTTDNTMRAYNKKYRGIDKATDVLSFPYWPDLKPGQHIAPEVADDKHLGDILISLEYVHNQLDGSEVTLDQRVRELLVHGVCHLIGYDHKTDAQYKQMKEKEDWLLEHLKKIYG